MEITNAHELGALVRNVRNEKGLSQTQLAQLVGTTRQWLSRFEQGSNDVSLALAFSVLAELGITLRDSAPPQLQPEEAASGPFSTTEAPSTEDPEADAAHDSVSHPDTASHNPTKRQSIPSLGLHPRKRSAVPPALPGKSAPSGTSALSGASAPSGTAPGAGKKTAEYSIDADIARIANSSLFKKSR